MGDFKTVLRDIVVFVLFATVSMFIGFAIGITTVTTDEHAKAIEAGVGRWVVDAKTGEKAFVYGVPKDEAK
jgi:hypothetical protein